MQALIVIDYVNDFVATEGKLTCGAPGQAVDANIAALVTSFPGVVVVASDCHMPRDLSPENDMFPPHCIVDTDGRDVYGQTADALAAREHIVLDKWRYSAFAGTQLDMLLRQRGVTGVHLVGVCTDICVLHTAVDAYNLGYKITVHAGACASFDPEGHAFALKHMQGAMGAKIID